jgi:F1F0 ATPase subunit 2
MNEMMTGVLALLVGLLLGVMFFGGLWWTVRKCVTSKRPTLWLLSSLLLRTSTAMIGFYMVADGHWQRMLLCLLGFLMARHIVTRLTRPSGEAQTGSLTGTSHAP